MASRDLKSQLGYLVLADISGFTSFLAHTELDHAREIVTDLLETISSRFTSLLTVSKFEGDAVFAFSTATAFGRGETLLELLESTYAAFRSRIDSSHRRTTCECRACGSMSGLDLKFFVHRGEFIVQRVSGNSELLGSDVNLAHRLMKNRVVESTGWRAYVLFTRSSLESLGIQPEGAVESTEEYEHLGRVQTVTLDLRPRYEALIDARRFVVSREEAHVVTERDFPVAPEVVWEWLNEPQKRALWVPGDLTFIPISLPGGRTGIGAQTHCVHGKKTAVVETILDWRPFDYFTVEQVIGPMTINSTYRLTPTGESQTNLEVFERGHITGIAWLDRVIVSLLFGKILSTAKLLLLLRQKLSPPISAEQSSLRPKGHR